MSTEFDSVLLHLYVFCSSAIISSFLSMSGRITSTRICLVFFSARWGALCSLVNGRIFVIHVYVYM